MAQLVLDLACRPALGRDDFFVTSCNRDAVAWIDRWPDWPMTGLALSGPAGSGKTHLGEVWRRRSSALSVDVDALREREPPALLEGRRNLMLDLDAGVTLPPELEETLLHLYNLIAEQNGHLVVASRTPPARWPVVLADLSSRLRAMASVSIAAPDDDLLTAVLLKQFDDRQISVDGDVIAYAVARMERSFEAAGALVEMLDREALARHRRIGVPLVRAVLDRERRQTERTDLS